MQQLEFVFDEKYELGRLRADVGCVRDSSERVRKSMFARHAELAGKYADLLERMQLLERHICIDGANMSPRS